MTSADGDRPVALVLRALYLGDLLTGLPALRLLRDRLPHHQIVLAAPGRYAPLLALADTVDRLVPVGELEPLDAAPRGAEVAVDLHGNGPRSRRLLERTEPRRLVAFGRDGRRWRRDEHEVHRWCRLVDESFPAADPPAGTPGWPPLAGRLRPPAGPSRTGTTVVHPGASSGARCWPADRYAAVVGHLVAQGHDVVVTGGTGERRLAERVAGDDAHRVRTDVTLLELAALVAAARLVVCGDTGLAHLASVYRTPSVVLFGPTPASAWGPPDDPRHVVLWKGTGRGDPHADAPHPALLAITVDEVAAACSEAAAWAASL